VNAPGASPIFKSEFNTIGTEKANT